MPTKKATAEAPSGITAEQLAEKVGRDGKTVRAYLRTHFARTEEQKGARWLIDSVLEQSVVDHYAAMDARQTAEVSAG